MSEGQIQMSPMHMHCPCFTSHVPYALAVLAAPVPKLGLATGVTGYRLLQLPCHPAACLAGASSGFQPPLGKVSAATCILWYPSSGRQVGQHMPWFWCALRMLILWKTCLSWRRLRRDHPRCPQSTAIWVGGERSGQSNGRKSYFILMKRPNLLTSKLVRLHLYQPRNLNIVSLTNVDHKPTTKPAFHLMHEADQLEVFPRGHGLHPSQLELGHLSAEVPGPLPRMPCDMNLVPIPAVRTRHQV